jgi:rare lipoprotein A
MRPKSLWRKKRLIHVAIVTIMLSVPATALALSGTVADTQAAQSAALQAQVSPRRLSVNHIVSVSGTAPSSTAGHRAVVQTALSPGGPWRTLASTQIDPSGRFQVRVRLSHSGYIRVFASQQVLASAARVSRDTATAPPGTPASSAVPVVVHAHFRLRQRTVNVLGGGPMVVSGHLMPALPGRHVRLQGRYGQSWRTLGSGRTSHTGGFRIRAGAIGGQNRRLRVLFAGDRVNAASVQPAGRMTVFTADVASWYNDAGNTACGYHAGLGVANRTLPCGTKVRFYHGGRTVTATVDDRGPFVGGRNWDLNQNTAAALGFGGVGTVWVAH